MREFQWNFDVFVYFFAVIKFLSFLSFFVHEIGFPAAAYAAYAAGRSYSGYPSFGLPYPTGNNNFIIFNVILNTSDINTIYTL